jgi:hypothetical protein
MDDNVGYQVENAKLARKRRKRAKEMVTITVDPSWAFLPIIDIIRQACRPFGVDVPVVMLRQMLEQFFEIHPTHQFRAGQRLYQLMESRRAEILPKLLDPCEMGRVVKFAATWHVVRAEEAHQHWCETRAVEAGLLQEPPEKTARREHRRRNAKLLSEARAQNKNTSVEQEPPANEEKQEPASQNVLDEDEPEEIRDPFPGLLHNEHLFGPWPPLRTPDVPTASRLPLPSPIWNSEIGCLWMAAV